MDEVASGVWRLKLGPRDTLNAYLIGDVLVDAGLPGQGPAVLAMLGDRPVRAHALTHSHPDHSGGSRSVVERFGVPVWVGADDAADVEAGRLKMAGGGLVVPAAKLARLPRLPVARRLREGDDVAGFTVVPTPGHTLGHLALWREEDRVLIAGDTFFGLRLRDLRPAVRVPPRLVTPYPGHQRRSMQRAAALAPALTLFGHGPPGRGGADARAAVARGEQRAVAV